MNTTKLVNILLAVALVCMSVALAFKGGSYADSSSAAADASTGATPVDAIMNRTSIRDYLDKPVEKEKVETLLRAAMAAPSARNIQPWRFVVIDDRATLDTIASRMRNAAMAAKAPMAIVVCGDTSTTNPDDGEGYWVQDCSAATENLLIAAHAQGLGAVWCGVYPVRDRVAIVRSLLNLPDSITPLNVVPVGYPAEDQLPKDKWKESSVHTNRW